MTAAPTLVLVNPISGTGGRSDIARRRARQAAALATQHGIAADVRVSEYPGHIRDLARDAVARGLRQVVVWGGDGSVNEAGGALAFTGTELAIVPSGSGNGLARELGIPLDPAAAFAVLANGAPRVIDCGELDGRLFFNVAGIGLDARVAHEFAARGLVRRGLSRYVEVTARELLRYRADEHAVVVDGRSLRSRALMIAIANSRQYGNGAIIAPDAHLDDGRLDVIVVDERPVWRTVWQAPRLFAGRIAEVPGVTMLVGSTVQVTSVRQVLYHVDGEPFVGATSLSGKVHPRAIRVRARSVP